MKNCLNNNEIKKKKKNCKLRSRQVLHFDRCNTLINANILTISQSYLDEDEELDDKKF